VKSKRICFLAVLVILLMTSVWLYAHHGYAAYDLHTLIKVKGTVTEYTMANPHSTIDFDAKDDKGNVQHWVAELGHVRMMKERGWTKDSLKPGDVGTFHMHPTKNGTLYGALEKVVFEDGRELMYHPKEP
jgi:hypothetical protein